VIHSLHPTSIVAAATRHPWRTLSIAAAIAALSILALSHVHVDSTLAGMLGGGSPAADALARITDEFEAAEDLLVVACAPDDLPLPEAQARLQQFGDRFVRMAERSPEAPGRIASIGIGSDPSIARFIRDVVLPGGTYYLDDETFGALLARLSSTEVRAQLAQTRTMLAAPGPGAAALARQLTRDPLRLREFVQARAAAGTPPEHGMSFSNDGRAILIRVSGSRPVNDIAFSKELTRIVRSLVEDSEPGRLRVLLGGGNAVAATSASVIRSDAIISSICSVVALALFFLFWYRRFTTPIFMVVSAGLGILYAFGLYATVRPALTPLVTVMASMMAGLGVDYAIHFQSHHQSIMAAGVHTGVASIRTTRDLMPPLAAACITTILGFATVTLGHVRMLRDFAVLGCLGLFGSLISVMIVLPALLELRSPATGRAGSSRLAARFARWSGRHRGLLVPLSWLLIGLPVAALLAAGVPCLETDTSVMHPRPNPALEASQLVRDRFSIVGETMFVHVAAATPDDLLARCHDVAEALATPAARATGVRGTFGLASLVPDPRKIESRRARLEALDRDAIVAVVREEFDRSEFDPAAFTDYFEFLDRLLSGVVVPSVAEIPEVVRREILPASSRTAPPGTQAVVIVSMSAAASHRTSRGESIDGVRAHIAGVRGATLTGITVVSHDLVRTVRRDLLRLSSLAFLLVVAWVFLTLRRPLDVALALVPVVYAGLGILGGMSAFGMRLDTVNMVAMPLLAGIAVDSGIFMVAGVRRAARQGRRPIEALAPTLQAVFATSITTALGFGTLVWTHTPAVQSLGRIATIGILSALVGSVLFVLPVLAREDPSESVP